MAEFSPYAITDTYQLLDVVERIKPPSSYLTDMFFPNRMPVSYSTWVSTEFRAEGRILAPFVSKLGRGVNINRGTSRVFNYRPPMLAPRRVIGLDDIELRQFGEQTIFS